MLKRKILRKSLLSLAVCSALFTTSVFAAPSAPGDYDADGTSDLSVALVDRNSGTTAWLTRLTNGSTPLFWTFNKAADAYVSGRFFSGNARFFPAIVRVTSASVPLEWTFKTPTNTEITNRFGLPGDTITNLGDWDGDGREDMHVVRKGSGAELQWYVFLSGYAQIVQVPFGLDGDQVGVSDVDNDGQVELVALRNGYTWYIRKPFADRDQTIAVQWGLNGDRPLLPRDLDGDNTADFIITRVVGANQLAFIKYGNGNTVATMNLGQATSIPQVGKFGNNANFAWSQRDTGWAAIGKPDASNIDLFKFGIPTNAIIRPDGTVVQPSSNAAFPATSTTPPTEDKEDETPTPPSGGGGGSFSECQSVMTVPAGGTFIYKNSAPMRSGGVGTPLVGYRIEPTLIMNSNVSSRSTANVFDSKGNVLTRCPWASAHGHAGGRFRCTINTTSMVREAVRNTGNPAVYFKLNGSQCAKVVHSGKCYGSVKGRCNETFQ